MALRLAEVREASLVFFPQIAFERDGVVHRADARDVTDVAFEDCAPVRSFPSWRGKRNYSGWYWASTTGTLVGFESLAEKTALMMLDRDPDVVAIASQPMWITWPRSEGFVAHAPDFFVRLASGEGEVIDVRPEQLVDERARSSFEATRVLCEQIGIGYRVISDIPSALVRNLLFLSQFRAVADPQHEDIVSRLAKHDLTGTIRSFAAMLSPGDPVTGLAIVYRLIWLGIIDVDLGKPIELGTQVRATTEARA